eukprot:3142081-Amphidinium_carterae.1
MHLDVSRRQVLDWRIVESTGEKLGMQIKKMIGSTKNVHNKANQFKYHAFVWCGPVDSLVELLLCTYSGNHMRNFREMYGWSPLHSNHDGRLNRTVLHCDRE